jgi:uncharacterized membrane protein
MALDFLTKENVGGLDLMIRSFLGTISLIALAMDLVDGIVAWILALVAFIGIFSSLTRHCTPYSILGLSTKKTCGIKK